MEIAIAVISFIVGLGGAVGVINKWLVKPLKELMTKVKEDQEYEDYCRMLTLKQAIYDERLPDAERVEAGDLYITRGFNHYTRTYVEEILKPNMLEKIKVKAERRK